MSFTEPSNDFGDVTSVDVPDLRGTSLGVARAELAAAGFRATVSPSPVQSDQPMGTVAYTSPGGGSKAEEGTSVLIYISNGGNSPGDPGQLGEPDNPGGPVVGGDGNGIN
jgi:beta-lactam-binding protein with PASTA domain